MSEQLETFKRLKNDPQEGSQYLLSLLEHFVGPFLLRLDEVLDKRLVRTLLQCLLAILRLRNNPQMLWLSELGSYLEGYAGEAPSAAAGTKRVGKLLRSVKWTVEQIDRYLLEKADEEVQKLKAEGKRILCLWDGSVLEKAESEKLEGIGPVLSVPRQTASADETGSDLQLASGASGEGDGNAMERRADRWDGWSDARGGEPMVDDERGVGDEAARNRGGVAVHHDEEMGTAARPCL